MSNHIHNSKSSYPSFLSIKPKNSNSVQNVQSSNCLYSLERE